ncbi:PDZ domain-containing protein [Geomicrobium halophilum]|uniref:endopeptidase La n=1 Tax=Geomicrobium halophilum TaxID=549000 RepID=A0A841PSX0_9BACL|nr:PDZ domain-containing protein [Geomicrobium halophilum]MBB6449401.1 PDZ domain-containing protein [Geomicrobium halophilum]
MSEEKNRWRFSKTWMTVGLVIVLLLVYQIPMPYYYSQPGDATGLNDFITVEEGTGEEGEFYLTTIRQSRANLILYTWSFLSSYRVLTPVDAVLAEGETDEEYQHRQAASMRLSQDASKIAAYRAAGANVTINENGVLVTQFVDDMGAIDVLESGDVITAVDGEEIGNTTELNESLAHKGEGDITSLTVNREGDVLELDVELMTFPEWDDEETGNEEVNAVGLGILGPIDQRDVAFDPEVTIEASDIGGPSAGLMFSLEIYNQLQDEDLTRGLDIAGTGAIDEEGDVGRIGGIGQKVVAADSADIDIFFAPNDNRFPGPTNYEIALESAEDIGTSMIIVPVSELQDAIDYLENEV